MKKIFSIMFSVCCICFALCLMPAESRAQLVFPNLTPYQPSGWTDKIVVSAKPGTNTDDPVQAGKTVYIDFAFANTGSNTSFKKFYAELYISGTRIYRSDYSRMMQDTFAHPEDIEYTFPEPGAYTLRLVCDADDGITELNENDNEYEREITVFQPPPNDDFADAAELSEISGQVSASNVNAAKETGEPDHAGSTGGKSLWWTWTAPEAGYFFFDTCGSTFNTLLAVYTGSDIENLISVSYNDDDGSPDQNSGLFFQAQAGIRYYIAADGKYGQRGDMILNWGKLSPVSAGQFEMNLYGEAYTNGEKIASEGCVIAALGPGGYADCRGISDFEASREKWEYHLALFSDSEGEKITFKIWDSSTGKIHNVKNTVPFEPGANTEKILNTPLTLISVSPDSGTAGHGLNVTLTGTGFDENTRVSMYMEKPLGLVETPAGIAIGVAVSGTTAYVADGNSLQIIDVSDSANPVITGSAYTPGDASGVALSGTTAFVADKESGLQIIDVSDPRNPVIIGSADTPGSARGVAVSGTTAFVADKEGGLQIIDVSNPRNPVIIGSADTPFFAYGVAVSGTTAFVADEEGGLQIIDVSDPRNPVIIGSADTPGFALGVAVSGTTAFVADDESGLQIIDVSDPRNPVIIGSADTPGEARGVAVSGTTAFVADLGSGLQIIDISDPLNPFITGSLDTSDYAWGVAVSGSIVFAAANSMFHAFPVPEKIAPLSAEGETSFSLFIPAPAEPGRYSLTVFNGTETHRLNSALTFVPDWIPGTGAYSAELYGGVYIDGTRINTDGCIIAAFGPGGDSDCRGISDISDSGGEWKYHLTLVSDHEGEDITFKIWDSSSARIYNVGDTVLFAAGTVTEKHIGMPLKAESAYPAMGISGTDIKDLLLNGSGFKENTGVFIFPDVWNRRSIIGSADTPGSAFGVAVSGTTAFVAD